MNKILCFIFVSAFSMLMGDQYSYERQSYHQDSFPNAQKHLDDQRSQSSSFSQDQQNLQDRHLQDRRSSETHFNNKGLNQNGRTTRENRGFLSDNRNDAQAQRISDQEIFENLQKKLGPGWFSRGYETVTFKVNNGNVLLQGTLETIEEKNKVEEIVKNIDGIRAINNQINMTGQAHNPSGFGSPNQNRR